VTTAFAACAARPLGRERSDRRYQPYLQPHLYRRPDFRADAAHVAALGRRVMLGAMIRSWSMSPSRCAPRRRRRSSWVHVGGVLGHGDWRYQFGKFYTRLIRICQYTRTVTIQAGIPARDSNREPRWPVLLEISRLSWWP
jgi:hypothetical protein